MSAYLLGLDIGTSATKAVLAGADAGVIAVAEHGYAMQRPHAGWAQNDPEDWWRASGEAVSAVLENARVAASEVAALCVVSQRDVVALVDESGAALAPSIHWSDRRDPEETDELFSAFGAARLHDICGTPPAPALVLANLSWSRRHEPSVLDRARWALSPKDLVALRLTGDAATDHTTPTRSLLNDWRTGGWSDEICGQAGVPLHLLPEIRHDPWEVRAVLDERAELLGLRAGTLLVAGGGDDPAAALGCGVLAPGAISVGASSSTSVRAVSTNPSVIPGSAIGLLAHMVPGRWLHELVAVGTGTSMRWFASCLTAPGAPPVPYDRLVAEAAGVPAGAGGVLFYPFVEGVTIPDEDMAVRGAFLGVEAHHTRGHLARAVMEGVAYQYPTFMGVLEDAGHAVESITISDGEARSALWNQIKADVLGRPLQVSTVAEAPAVGACVLAGVGAGIFADAEDGLARLTAAHQVVWPREDAHNGYAGHRRRWEEVRPHVVAAAHAAADLRDAARRP